MKESNLILRALLLMMVTLLSLNVGAKMNMGTIELVVGQEIRVESEPNTYYTVSGSWSKTGNAFYISAKSDRSCKIRATYVGTATLEWAGLINTTWSEMVWTIKVTEASVKVTNINLDKSQIELPTNNYEQLTATVSPSNATNKNVSWTSNNTNIATVSSTGLVYGVGAGTATITCKAADGSGVSATCKVTVTKEPTSISLPAEILVGVGETVTIPYTLEPENASSSITWKSSNQSIATVSSTGEVKGIKEGTANVTATTANGKSASCKVTVDKDLVRPTWFILLGNDNVEVGYSKKIRYTLEPENSTTTITWKSDDTSIATVSSDGIVKGIKQGSALITATTANGLTSSRRVYVGGFKDGTYFDGTSSDDYDVTYKVTDINAKTCEVYGCNRNVKRVSIQSSVMGYKVVGIGKNSFENCNLSEVSIPGTVKYINQGAFNNCEFLEKVDIAEGVETIGYIAFQSCDKLTSIHIPNSVKLIEQYAFHGNGLESISGMEGVEIIGEGAFKSTPLKSIHIPESVKEIRYQAFHYCNSLKTVTSLNKKPTAINDEAFGYLYYMITLYVPMGTKGIYQSTDGWKEFKNIVEFDPSGIDAITIDEDGQQTIYSISGVRLKSPQKGLNIINGKKVLVK